MDTTNANSNEEQVTKTTEAAAPTTTTTTTQHTDGPQRRYHANRERNNSQDDRGGMKEKRKYFRKKVCYFCKNCIDVVDYKDVKLLRRYVKESGKIIPRRLNGSCSKHQRMISKAIKRSRNIALLPFETRY